jgi:hypothetical protein
LRAADKAADAGFVQHGLFVAAPQEQHWQASTAKARRCGHFLSASGAALESGSGKSMPFDRL